MQGVRRVVGCFTAAVLIVGCGAETTRTIIRTVPASTTPPRTSTTASRTLTRSGASTTSSSGLYGSFTRFSAKMVTDVKPGPGDVIRIVRVPSVSMVPTVRAGQRVQADLSKRAPALGHVILFHPPAGATPSNPQVQAECGDRLQGFGKRQPCDLPTVAESSQVFIKRIVGMPGDKLRIAAGHVIRNGVQEQGSFAQPCTEGAGQCTFPEAIRVPPGDVYVMGDNRGLSDDSRFWGPVPERWILATVVNL